MATKRKSRPSHKAVHDKTQGDGQSGPQGEDSPQSGGISARWRLVISLGLLFHLLAVAVWPLSVQPASELELRTALALRWYVDPLFLNHGYRFFAPNPGPSDMMRVQVELKDGSTLPEIVYPDLEKQWPRLLYHRHFMLTSRLAQAPADPMGRALVESYARHLGVKHDVQEVRIYGQRHELATRDQVLRGVKLSDPSLYQTPYTSPVGTWRGRSASGDVATELVLEIGMARAPTRPGPQFPSGPAKLTGRLLGKKVELLELAWRDGPRSMAFEDRATGQTLLGEFTGPHEMLLVYALADGTQYTLLLTREPPPLAVYRGEAS